MTPISKSEFEKLLVNDYLDVKKSIILKGDDVSKQEYQEFISNNGLDYKTYSTEKSLECFVPNTYIKKEEKLEELFDFG